MNLLCVEPTTFLIKPRKSPRISKQRIFGHDETSYLKQQIERENGLISEQNSMDN